MTFAAKSDNGSVAAQYSRMPHYQAYYWLALSTVCSFSVRNAPWWYTLSPSSITALDVEAVVEQLRPRLGGKRQWNSPDLSDFVGRYIWRHHDKTIKFAVDAHDLKDIVAPDALEWCDIYFKANKWVNREYPRKVVPIVNGNGFLRHRHLSQLRKARHTPKTNDIIFISRIWGGVEHNVRLFEELAALPCKKRLVAIFVSGAGSSVETEAAKKRLEQVGVECTYDLISVRQLWEETASSKIVVLRAGKHLCIPWRMIDLLCMGACIVTDSEFYPNWPESLEPDTHYVSSGIDRPADTSSASPGEYEKVAENIMAILKNDHEQNRLRENSAAYFDNHAAPVNVGGYILSQLMNV